ELQRRSPPEPEVPPDALNPRTVSLGICAVRAVAWPDLLSDLSASDRERPFVTEVNGPLMARWSREGSADLPFFRRIRLSMPVRVAGPYDALVPSGVQDYP